MDSRAWCDNCERAVDAELVHSSEVVECWGSDSTLETSDIRCSECHSSYVDSADLCTECEDGLRVHGTDLCIGCHAQFYQTNQDALDLSDRHTRDMLFGEPAFRGLAEELGVTEEMQGLHVWCTSCERACHESEAIWIDGQPQHLSCIAGKPISNAETFDRAQYSGAKQALSAIRSVS